MQGLAMALYTQVRTAESLVGLNALEYIMQTVSFPLDPSFSLPPVPTFLDAVLIPVLQRCPLRLRSRALRHRLPWFRIRNALLLGAYRRYRYVDFPATSAL